MIVSGHLVRVVSDTVLTVNFTRPYPEQFNNNFFPLRTHHVNSNHIRAVIKNLIVDTNNCTII